jgi:hypothetical protein
MGFYKNKKRGLQSSQLYVKTTNLQGVVRRSTTTESSPGGVGLVAYSSFPLQGTYGSFRTSLPNLLCKIIKVSPSSMGFYKNKKRGLQSSQLKVKTLNLQGVVRRSTTAFAVAWRRWIGCTIMFPPFSMGFYEDVLRGLPTQTQSSQDVFKRPFGAGVLEGAAAPFKRQPPL